MKRFLTVLITLALSNLVAAEPRHDLVGIVGVVARKCQRDTLKTPSDMENLTILDIPLSRMCQCIAEQVVSRMSDEDIEFAAQNSRYNQRTIDFYAGARGFCAASLMAY
jgi:hypothetical protein